MATNSKIMVGSCPGWAIPIRSYYVSNIPTDKLTLVDYAFAGVSITRAYVSLNSQQ
jgi:GH18 family chitinase